MNRKVVINVLGKILLVISVLMLLPFAMTFIYEEGLNNILAFAIPILVIFTAGMIMTMRRVENYSLGIKDGLFITSTSWLLMSLVGAVPFMISQEIPNFFDAFFEITSGFTTTGASVLTPEQIGNLSKSLLFWRSFSHWIGGMGILVFVLAIAPKNNEYSMHILRAESPGPNVGKLVAKMSKSSRILYLIYIFLTLVLFGSLMLCKDVNGNNINWFVALCTSFGTAGTGGFVVTPGGIAELGNAAQYIIAVFMLLFGTNFSLFFLLLIHNFKQAARNEEIRWYLSTVVVAVVLVTINTYSVYQNLEVTFRTAFFQVSSIISTTGFSTVDYASWPLLSQCVIVLLMVVGSCAGSTAGGLKQSRVLLLVKKGFVKIAKVFNPRSVHVVRMDGVPVDDRVMANVVDFTILYFLIFAVCAILTSIYNPNLPIDNLTPITSITASLSCISNVGPGLGNVVGPTGNFASYSFISKLIFSIEMIAGRLELLPVLILFNPYTYKSKNSF